MRDSLSFSRPSRGGVQGAVGGAALISPGSRCGFDPAGGVPPQPVSDGGAPTPLDPALHPEPQGRPAARQEVCTGFIFNTFNYTNDKKIKYLMQKIRYEKKGCACKIHFRQDRKALGKLMMNTLY